MDFFIKYNTLANNSFDIRYIDSFICNMEENILYIERLPHLDYYSTSNILQKQVAVGDVIKYGNYESDLSACKGIFYLFEFENNNTKLIIKSDKHSLLPVYYFHDANFIYISSSFRLLANQLREKKINKKFYIDIALFLYQMDNETCLEGIKKIGYGDEIILNSDFIINNTKRFYNYFVEKPSTFKENLAKIADKFIEISQYYVKEPSAISLTGGFDGRVNTACALFHKADFITFSYGKKGNGDVDNPMYLADKLGFQYHLIDLNEFKEKEYLDNVDEYLLSSGGLNAFQFPQSLACIKEISNFKKIVVNGYVGSEILASCKGPGVELQLPSVVDYVKNESVENNIANQLFEILKQLRFIDSKNEITEALLRLKNYFDGLPNSLSKNQRIACYIFEHDIINLFGTWIYNGMHYAKMRVPFLDNDFFDCIIQTEVSQFYRPFLETSILKRIKGQKLYPAILSKTHPDLNKLMSSKGYSPYDITNILGLAKIFLRKSLKINNFKDTHTWLDRMSTYKGVLFYLDKYCLDAIDIAYYENVKKSLSKDEYIRSLCFLSLTQTELKRLLNQ